MSGSEALSDVAVSRLKALEGVLDRGSPIDALEALAKAIRPPAKRLENLHQSAIGLDANVLLRMGSRKYSADLLDYLGSRHAAPLILPGQAIQEFWNNQLAGIEPVAKSIAKAFKGLSDEVDKLEDVLLEFRDGMRALLDKFQQEHGYLYDESTQRTMQSVFDVLKAKARTPFVPRDMFRRIASSRNCTKTPPGFKDESDGDFYIWADFLYGLIAAANDGDSFDFVVFVTNDVKADWSRGGVAHPILAAEVAGVCGKPFEVWTLDEFASSVRTFSSAVEVGPSGSGPAA